MHSYLRVYLVLATNLSSLAYSDTAPFKSSAHSLRTTFYFIILVPFASQNDSVEGNARAWLYSLGWRFYISKFKYDFSWRNVQNASLENSSSWSDSNHWRNKCWDEGTDLIFTLSLFFHLLATNNYGQRSDEIILRNYVFKSKHRILNN